MAARVGKIARLPAKIREELNQRLLDGQSAGRILPWLNALPEVIKALDEDFEGLRINDQNLSDWRTGGFVDWQKSRERITRTRELAQYAAQQSRADRGSIASGAASIAAGHLLEMLEAVDEATGTKITPEALLKIAQAVSIVRVGDQNDVKLAQEKKKIKQKDEQIQLEREKFQRETAEIALKVLSDDRAKSIEAGTGTNAEKLDLMGNHIFGDLWTTAKRIRDQKPGAGGQK